MPRQSRGVMIRSQSNQTGRGGKAGGKAGKRTLGEGAREALKAAIAQAAAGEHAAAAAALKSLAATAGDRGKPFAAASIAIQGALAALAGGDVAGAVAIAEEGVALSAGVAGKRRVAGKFLVFTDALSAADTDAGAAFLSSLKSSFGLKMVHRPAKLVKPNRAQRRSLPKACPCCGSALDGKTIEFFEDGTLDCPLCGDAIA